MGLSEEGRTHDQFSDMEFVAWWRYEARKEVVPDFGKNLLAHVLSFYLDAACDRIERLAGVPQAPEAK